MLEGLFFGRLLKIQLRGVQGLLMSSAAVRIQTMILVSVIMITSKVDWEDMAAPGTGRIWKGVRCDSNRFFPVCWGVMGIIGGGVGSFGGVAGFWEDRVLVVVRGLRSAGVGKKLPFSQHNRTVSIRHTKYEGTMG